MTHVDSLLRLVAPPANPVEARGDWSGVEAALGLILPRDFKDLIETYGRGTFVDFLHPLRPFGTTGYLLFVEHAHKLLDRERHFREENPDRSPYPFHPEPGGLLQWAITDNGDYLCWLTSGHPDDWQVVSWNPRNCDYDHHNVGAAGFLVGWLSGDISTTVFPDTPLAEPWFEPFRELKHVTLKLSDSTTPYDERLRILRDALAPTADRQTYNRNGLRQDHFAATGLGWQLTYETAHGHQLRVAFPPEDEEQARLALLDAARRIGCQVLTAAGDMTNPWGTT